MMVREDKFDQALEALHHVLVRARFLAYQGESGKVADLLDGIELFPEYLGAQADMTGDVREMLAGLGDLDPGCARALEVFDGAATLK